MIPLILTLLIILIILSLLINQYITLSVTGFISTIILGFFNLIFHLITYSIPYELIILMLILIAFCLLKHHAILFNQRGRHFIKQMCLSIMRLILFMSAYFYISLSPLVIINGITLWLSLIGFTTLFAFLCYLTWSSTFGSRHFNQSVDLIIVLGAGIFTEEVTPMLKERLDRALEIYHHSENIPKLLVSGGQGPDEPIPESIAMQRYLIKQGVPNDNILLEQQSTNTHKLCIF